ncbi:MAG: FAD-dependent oxidoreductase [Solirubrobacterales bacterium]
MATRAKVLIIGGGVAAVEAAVALRELAGDRVQVEMCAPREDFVYRPFAVGEPYGHSRPLRYGIQRIADSCGASFRLGSIVSIDAEERVAVTHDGDRLPYDYLIVACGARMLWAVPGTIPFWGVVEEGGLQGIVREMRDGGLRRVIFTTPGISSWGLPVYELALLAETELARAGVGGTRLTVVTPEEAPLELFGRRASVEAGELLAERGIEVIAGAHPVKFEDGRLTIAPGGDIVADAVISLPRLEGRRIDGVPHDEEGFVPVDEHGWVVGVDHVLAAGDITTFPVKQGGIAAQQADAAAEALAAAVGCDLEPECFDPVLRGVLWTDGEPRYLYGELSGGHGETSLLSDEAPWATEQGDKIIGRYLNPFLAQLGDVPHR